jgi:hypothetical protein
MNERRFESRFLCADLVKADWMAGEDEFRTVEAVLEDISPVGACIQVEERIPLGVPIAISATSAKDAANKANPDDGGQASFFGIVSYCVYRDYGYFVGIRLSDETRWSQGVFNPQHLTNLAELAY